MIPRYLSQISRRLWCTLALTALVLSSCGEKSNSSSTPDEVASPPSAESSPQVPAATEAGASAVDPSPVPAAPVVPLAQSEQPLTTGQQKEVLDQVLAEEARRQAEGLGSGMVRVNGAWPYVGHSTLSPNPEAAIEARLVAVDITISGHTPWFDLDDIEIVEGKVDVSYGSDPDIEPLRADGTLMNPEEIIPAAPNASRWLLIYAYPKASKSFRLYYWGKELTPTPIVFGTGGLSLPYPEIESAGDAPAAPAGSAPAATAEGGTEGAASPAK